MTGSETSTLLNESATRIFSSLEDREIREAQAGQWPASRWQQVAEAGFPLAFVSEDAGGFGVKPSEAMTLLRTAGSYAVPLPLAETMLANRLLTEAGFEVAEGAATVAPVAGSKLFSLKKSGARWQVTGRAGGVPWARNVDTIVLLAENDGKPFIVRLARKAATVEQGPSLSGLPTDFVAVDTELSVDDVRPASAHWNSETLLAAGAALRVAEMAGALERVLEMTVAYANERVQFGKPIGKQQAIQQQLAILAGQAAACGAAADIAGAAFERLDVVAIAAAKARAGEAASIAAPIAHQVHGAIGFTEEHRLHFFTRRLWAWRDEFGSQRYWSAVVGRKAIAAGGDGIWPFVVSLGAAQEA